MRFPWLLLFACGGSREPLKVVVLGPASANPTAQTSASAVTMPTPSGGKPSPSVRQIAAGGDTTCALLADKTVRCWGDGQFSIVGPTRSRENPRPRAIALTNVAQVSVGAAHACARLEDGTVSCWGSNYSGEIGTGLVTSPPGADIDKPTPALGVKNVISVSANAHTAVLLADKTVMFWGDWDSGSGDPRPAGSAKPALIANLKDAVEIADTGFGACARLTSGAVRCWYMVSPGLIPRGKDRVDPVSIPIQDAVALFPDSNGMCALTKTQKLVCWTMLVTRIVDPHPAIAALTDIAEMAVGSPDACVRRKNGQVMCETKSGLAVVTGLSNPTALVAGSDHFCALEADRVLCWGENTWGQLGDGTTTKRAVAAPVVF